VTKYYVKTSTGACNSYHVNAVNNSTCWQWWQSNCSWFGSSSSSCKEWRNGLDARFVDFAQLFL